MDFNDSAKPIYLQLADQLADDVQNGLASPEERLPSVRDFASRIGVNPNTAMRAYSWLQQEGIIYQKRGIGYFYSADARDIVRAIRRKAFYDRELPRFIERMVTLGISPAEFLDYFNKLS